MDTAIKWEKGFFQISYRGGVMDTVNGWFTDCLGLEKYRGIFHLYHLKTGKLIVSLGGKLSDAKKTSNEIEKLIFWEAHSTQESILKERPTIVNDIAAIRDKHLFAHATAKQWETIKNILRIRHNG